jgi:hypothetical protein
MLWQSTYGFLTKTITSLAPELGKVLQFEWQVRDSEAWGDYYLYPPFVAEKSAETKETFKLYSNHLKFEGWKNLHFKNCAVLLDVITEKPLEIDKLLFRELRGKILLIQRAALDP